MSEPFAVVWSGAAVRDLDRILECLADSASIDRALKLYERIRRRVSSPSRYPRRCRNVAEVKELGFGEFRELLVAPYRVFHRLDGSKVVLLGILDGRRDLEELLIQRALAGE